MNLFCRSTLLLTLFLISVKISYAQQGSVPAGAGEVYGTVRDSAHNYVLQLASVAVYQAKDSVLLSYQLSNSFGEFRFRNMPVGVQLKVIVSYIGYKSAGRTFTIPEKNKFIDLKELTLDKNMHELKEVVVKYIPPVRMNHDTLEFNAEAFSLDKNAVVEDLLRKLPHLTVWGDGTITVNGKQVKQVLVNGKPFFGGDTRVAIQNVPKNAVDKIQVYKERQAKGDVLDSTILVNIKLKKDKAFGSFGKVSAGYGTGEQYESDANINLFNKQTQLSLVGTANNSNKVPDDASTLLRNSTYKGIGTNIEYQPDFTLSGVNQSRAGGMTLQHDFIPNASYNNTSRLTTDYFIKNKVNTTITDSRTITTLGADSTQTQQVNNRNKLDTTAQQLKVRYERRKRFLSMNAGVDFHAADSHSASSGQTNLYGSSGTLQSTNNTNNVAITTSESMTVNLDINTEKDYAKMNYLPGNWSVSYKFNAGNWHNSQTDTTLFTTIGRPSQNKKFNRLYNNNHDDGGQYLKLGLGDFSGLLFGGKGFVGISILLENDLDFTTHKEDNVIRNRDSTGIYQVDPYLTNVSKLSVVNEEPGLVLGKSFLRELANRYKKLISLYFILQEQLLYQKNNSVHDFQNFERNYQKFLPNASVSYRNDQYGDFDDEFTLSFSTVANYPTVNQLHPIVDSINQYYIALGNPKLREATEHKVSFKMEHISQRTKNTFGYSAGITAGLITNGFADSSLTDNSGRSRHYTVNTTGSRYMNISGNLTKAFKFDEHQLQLQFYPSLSFSRSPVYINSALNISNTISGNTALNLFYTLNNWWAVDLRESLLFYDSRQSGANSIEFINSTLSTIFATTVNFTKRLSVGSNASCNRAASTGATVSSYTIWNANATYRMLKGNNLEFKFAALDLLHQNTGIINMGMNNTITRGTTNVLQQYFMLSLAFYPRQFGSKEKHKEGKSEPSAEP